MEIQGVVLGEKYFDLIYNIKKTKKQGTAKNTETFYMNVRMMQTFTLYAVT